MTVRRAALGSLVVLIVVYGAAPWLAARLLPPLLARWGVESSQFAFGYPRWNGVDVLSLKMANADTTVHGSDVHVTYRIARLLVGEVEAVDVDELTVHSGAAPRVRTLPDRSTSPRSGRSFRRVRSSSANSTSINADPAVSARGSVSFDPEVLQVRLGVESPLLAVPLDVSGAVNPDGRVAVTLMERGTARPLGSLTGVPDRDRSAMEFEGRIALTGRPLALAGAYEARP